MRQENGKRKRQKGGKMVEGVKRAEGEKRRGRSSMRDTGERED